MMREDKPTGDSTETLRDPRRVRNHTLEVYLNLARRMKLTGIDQLWVADITYIRLRAEFVYLAVIPVGFSLDRSRS